MSGMVTFKNVGRMGNFLFEAAATMGYAWRHKLEFTIPDKTNDCRSNPLYLQHLVNPKYDPKAPMILIKERQHSYQELPFRKEWDGKRNIVLDGYWQTEKYFKEFRDRILQTFGFNWYHIDGMVSVHVRRGDYLTLTEKHPPVPKKWYEKMMDLFPGYRFMFFSDDLPWCKQEFGDRTDVMFSEGKNEVDDLVLMSCCEHHICSASTFAWWGAWLNRHVAKRVIMPRHWFQPGYRKTDTSDIVPPDWERL